MAETLSGPCPLCGASLALVGRMHRCRPRAAPVVAPALAAAPVVPAKAKRKPVTHAVNTEGTHAGVLTPPKGTHATKGAAKRAKWRAAHPDKHAAQQRAARARKPKEPKA